MPKKYTHELFLKKLKENFMWKKTCSACIFFGRKNAKYMNQNDVYFTKIEKLLKYINEIEDEILEWFFG